MSTNGEQGPEARPMPRLVVKVDSKPDLDLQMERGTTVMVEYRRDVPTPPEPNTGTASSQQTQEIPGQDEQPKYDLFLSYSGSDEKWVRQLADRIEEKEWQGRKLTVFLAKRDIQPGENWVMGLANALQGSRKVGIILSPEAMQSSFVEAELTAAINRSLSSRQQLVIPLYLRDCPIPSFLSETQYIDFRNPNKYEESLAKLIDILCKQPPAISVAPPLSQGPVRREVDGLPLLRRPLPSSRPPRERIKELLMKLHEEDLEDFLFYRLNMRWDDLPGLSKREKIRSLIQLYELEEHGVDWLHDQVERFTGELQASLRPA